MYKQADSESSAIKPPCREEFRAVLGKVVASLRGQLQIPGVSPFNPVEIAQWLNQVTPEDVQAVWDKQD